MPLEAISWQAAFLGEAFEAIADRAGLPSRTGGRPTPTPWPLGPDGPDAWIEAAARGVGLEAELVDVPHGEVERLIRAGGPALLRLPASGGRQPAEVAEPRFLILLGASRRGAVLLTPERSAIRRPLDEVRAALCEGVEATTAPGVEQVLQEVGLRGPRLQRAREALLRQLLSGRRVGPFWLLRASPAAGPKAEARAARLPHLLAVVVGAHVVALALFTLSWWLLGWMTLHGRFDRGWLAAWLLLLLSAIPFRLLGSYAGGLLSLRCGILLKRRLLLGAMRLERDEGRHLGAGQILGCVLESDAVPALALAGGFLALTAGMQLVLAGVILGAGAGSGLLTSLLVATALAAGGLTRRFYRRLREWTGQRLDMTHDLIERMAGHRTRLAQEPRAFWNDGEDAALENYLETSARLDRQAVLLQVLVPRGWLLLALLALAPGFLAGQTTTETLAVSIGGVLLAYDAFRRLVESLERLAAAALAWERIRPFWQAASCPELVGRTGVTGTPTPASLLDARDLVFSYPDRPQPVLRGVSLRIGRGERLLLEGASGGGKSTLASLLAGARRPSAGLLLLDGLDLQTAGADGWRRHVALTPQFSDNHVLMGTFAFNVLMGRGWPPRPKDLEEVERICRALDLGPLLDRMPAGIHQVVGETGWQLSHGEKSRLYLARALLQGADFLLLDESFGALDPQTLRHTLAFVLEQTPALLVIAHP
jgi:ATP-binding cassette subfamily B protein